MNKLVEITQYLVQRYALILNYVHKMTEKFQKFAQREGRGSLERCCSDYPALRASLLLEGN